MTIPLRYANIEIVGHFGNDASTSGQMQSPDRYKMNTVVRATGFTPALLRAWERRHGVLQPDRGDGGHRLYTPDDLAILRYLKLMRDEGRSIGEMARLGRETLLTEAKRRPGGDATPKILRPAQSGGETPTAPASDILAMRRIIVKGATDLDASAIDGALDQAFSVLSPAQVIEGVIEPCAKEIGDLWSRGVCTVASEHLVSELFMARLRSLLAAVKTRRGDAPQVVLSCFPDEHHELGILILGFHFSTLGWRVIYLGAALPFEDLERALSEAKPQAAVLSVATTSVYAANRPRLMAMLRRNEAGPPILIGGQGVPESDPDVEEAGGLICANGRPVVERLRELLARGAASSARK